MTQEEKAKAYDEAIKRLGDIKTGKCQKAFVFTEGLFNYLFPEIKECNEDERIRKALICHISKISTEIPVGALHRINGVDIPDILAWLEKQNLIMAKSPQLGEQKPAWSEEDENEVAILEAYIRSGEWSESHIDRALGIVDELVNKVKSLRPQKQWKPSDEQMADLWNMVCECRPSDQQLLQDLYYGLKTLRGE